jgi:hypothetical protein
MPEEIANNTSKKYFEAYELLTGKKWMESPALE